MWIRLDLEGLKFELKIEDYLPNQTLDGKWSNVSFNFEFQNIIKYSQNRSENMLCYEIDELILKYIYDIFISNNEFKELKLNNTSGTVVIQKSNISVFDYVSVV